jgi:membrane AbrB-like protein
MIGFFNFVLYAGVGLFGGFLGYKIKIPAGALIGSLVFVILAKLLLKSDWQLPKQFIFFIQVLLGIMVGATFHPSLLPVFHKILIPVVLSCVILVGTGVLMAIVFTKLGLLDLGTGYLGTSPGAMTALLSMALENNVSVNATIITCFHLFRVIFVILTAPIIFKFIID